VKAADDTLKLDFGDAADLRLLRRFEAYDRANPAVYALFRRFACEMRAAGRARYGSKGVLERIRWHVHLEASGGDFKINNDYSPYFARKLMAEDETFRGFFEVRATVGDGKIAGKRNSRAKGGDVALRQ
jgi:hypothetical protein